MPKLPTDRKLSANQEAVIADVVKSVKDGERFSIAKSVERIHKIKPKSASTIAGRNWKQQEFREALLSALEERQIIGANSKVEQRLVEGLDAEGVMGIDFRTRLEYVKEINKISGVYAPEKRETMKLNLNMTKEEMDEKISQLRDELGDMS